MTFCRTEAMPNRKNLVISFVLSFVMYLIVTAILDATVLTSFMSPIWRIFGLTVLVPWLVILFLFA